MLIWRVVCAKTKGVPSNVYRHTVLPTDHSPHVQLLWRHGAITLRWGGAVQGVPHVPYCESVRNSCLILYVFNCFPWIMMCFVVSNSLFCGLLIVLFFFNRKFFSSDRRIGPKVDAYGWLSLVPNRNRFYAKFNCNFCCM